MKAKIGETYALVQNGKVQQIFTIDDLPEWHDGLDVRNVTGQGVTTDWIDVDGVLTPPPSPTADELLAQEREGMVCSCAQGEIALHQAGLLDQVLAVVSADPVLDIAWRRAVQWRRTSATMKRLTSTLGWTDEFVDDLFRAAMRIEL